MNLSKFFSKTLASALTAITIVIIATAISSAAPPDRISIAYSKASVPFHFSDESGQPTGIIMTFGVCGLKRPESPLIFGAPTGMKR